MVDSWSISPEKSMAVPTNQPLASDPTLPRLIPQLPDELSLHCIARVPRSSHPDLALVSRSWRSLLRSPLLFKLRSDLGITEPSLCIHVRHRGDQSRWYLLIRGRRRRPDRLLPLPPTPTPMPTCLSASAVLSHSLFVLGGSNSGISSSAVQIFNTHTNSWMRGPQMGTARKFATASTLDGWIYVVGGCPPKSDSWVEAFDLTSGVWAHVPSPPPLREELMHGSAVLSGRLFAVAGKAGVVFDPAAAEPWTAVSESLYNGWRGREAVVNGVLYSYGFEGKLIGYDPVTDNWMPVEGMERELPNLLYGSTLADLGGLLCLVWLGSWRSSEETEINCVGIEITRTSCGGLRGSVAWRESALVAMLEGSLLGQCVTLEF